MSVYLCEVFKHDKDHNFISDLIFFSLVFIQLGKSLIFDCHTFDF